MKHMYQSSIHHLWVLFLLVGSLSAIGQTTVEYRGRIIDPETGYGIAGAGIKVDGNSVSVADSMGVYAFSSKESDKANVVVEAPGYSAAVTTLEKLANTKSIALQGLAVSGNEVVVSASRYSEKYLSSPATISKINRQAIAASASGDYFESLGNLKNVNVLGSSLTFKVFNTRGFGTTSPFRIVQMTDGMDAQSAGLNFAPGTMLSVPDIDIDNMEIISGPASALYGPNAFQGVVSIHTTDPFKRQGLAVSLKGASRNYFEAQAMYADVFGKKKKFGMKLSAGYMFGKDWEATTTETNSYLPVSSPPQNLNAKVAGWSNNADADYGDFNTYTQTNANAKPNSTPPGTSFVLKPFAENDMWNRNVNSLKINSLFAYRFTDEVQLSYQFRLARATSVYQGNNRAALKDFLFHQHKLELLYDNHKSHSFLFRIYTNLEDAGNSYDLVLTGVNLGLGSLGGVTNDYLKTYVNAIDSMSGNFSGAVSTGQVAAARAAALASVGNSWLKPGTAAYDSTLRAIITDRNRPYGAMYTSRANMQHADAQYNFTSKWINVNVGVSGRRYQPVSDGYIVDDAPDSSGKKQILQYYEFGGFVQLSKSFLQDKIQLLASFRADKSQNFDFQFSPRGAVMLNFGNHHLRVAAQMAFRTPTLNDQYFNLNTGALVVKGNLEGYSNVYTQASVDAYNAVAPPLRDPATLQATTVAALKPENLVSVELGYRALVADRLFIDFDAYYNRYTNFIGGINVAALKTGTAGDSSGVAAINTRQYTTYSLSVNSSTPVQTFGVALGLNARVWKSLSVYANYTFSYMDTVGLNDNLIPGYNTPMHKINVGVEARRLWKGLGFGVNFRWVDKYQWRSPFTDRAARLYQLTADQTYVPAYHTMDLQINYVVDKWFSTFRIGASNLYYNKHIEVYGGPEIGGFYYGSWTFDIPMASLKKK
jgi:iron complex outermembrane receptor protein